MKDVLFLMSLPVMMFVLLMLLPWRGPSVGGRTSDPSGSRTTDDPVNNDDLAPVYRSDWLSDASEIGESYQSDDSSLWSSSSFPEHNVDGTPMISGTDMDYAGHHYGDTSNS